MVAEESLLADLAAIVAERLSPERVSADQWSEIVSFALENGLGPTFWRIIERSVVDSLDSTGLARLAASARAATVHCMVLGEAHRQIQARLAAAGIPALWLKGFALAHTVYPDPTLRPMVDLDVLVPFERRLAALRALESAGFHRTEVNAFDALPRLIHHFSYNYTLRGGLGDAVTIELHFHLLDRVRQKPLLAPEQLGWFWDHAQWVSRVELPFQTLTAEAHLLYLSAHAILQHGASDPRLLRFFDLHRLIVGSSTADPLGSSIDWRVVVDRAVELRWTGAVERALAMTTRLFGTPVPPWVFSQLRERRPGDEEVYCVVERQASTNHVDDLDASWACLTLSERLQVLCALAIPSSRHLRYRYSLPDGQPTWPHYPRLWLDQASELARWFHRRGNQDVPPD